MIATYPNEYLHVDTTFYPLANEELICICFVLDNYSKMIMGWHIDKHNGWHMVVKAMKQTVKHIIKHPDKREVTLVADGGRENHNHKVDEFLEKLSNYKITKKQARSTKGIKFSNSPVEALHRTLKGRYLKNRKFDSIRSLKKFLEWAVKDYNECRPHSKHGFRTPYEAYYNIPLPFDPKKRSQNAVQLRVKKNLRGSCIQCISHKTCSKPCANLQAIENESNSIESP